MCAQRPLCKEKANLNTVLLEPENLKTPQTSQVLESILPSATYSVCVCVCAASKPFQKPVLDRSVSASSEHDAGPLGVAAVHTQLH